MELTSPALAGGFYHWATREVGEINRTWKQISYEGSIVTGFEGDSKSVWPERKYRKQQVCRCRVWGTKGWANHSQLEDKTQVPKGWELRLFKELKKKKRKKENGENRREKEKYVKENLCNLQNLKWLLPDPLYKSADHCPTLSAARILLRYLFLLLSL